MILSITKQIQRKHIKTKVSEIGMNQTAGEKSVPLISFRDCRRIKDQIVDNFLVAETIKDTRLVMIMMIKVMLMGNVKSKM
jgi:hypothetical protein